MGSSAQQMPSGAHPAPATGRGAWAAMLMQERTLGPSPQALRRVGSGGDRGGGIRSGMEGSPSVRKQRVAAVGEPVVWAVLSPGLCSQKGLHWGLNARCWHPGIPSHCSCETAVSVMSQDRSWSWSLCSHRQFRPRSPWGRPPLPHPPMLANPSSTMALCPGGVLGAWSVRARSTAHPELTGSQHIWGAPRPAPPRHWHALVACPLGMGVAGSWRDSSGSGPVQTSWTDWFLCKLSITKLLPTSCFRRALSGQTKEGVDVSVPDWL